MQARAQRLPPLTHRVYCRPREHTQNMHTCRRAASWVLPCLLLAAWACPLVPRTSPPPSTPRARQALRTDCLARWVFDQPFMTYTCVPYYHQAAFLLHSTPNASHSPSLRESIHIASAQLRHSCNPFALQNPDYWKTVHLLGPMERKQTIEDRKREKVCGLQLLIVGLTWVGNTCTFVHRHTHSHFLCHATDVHSYTCHVLRS